MNLVKVAAALIGTLAVLVGLGWLGLQVKPKPFPAYSERTPALETVELPRDLPAAVVRYYEAIIGDRIPVIESAVITGRGKLRILASSAASR